MHANTKTQKMIALTVEFTEVFAAEAVVMFSSNFAQTTNLAMFLPRHERQTLPSRVPKERMLKTSHRS